MDNFSRDLITCYKRIHVLVLHEHVIANWWIFFIVGLSAVVAVSIAIGTYATAELKLVVNGQAVNAEAKLIDGTTYVPLRAVTEMLDAMVGWDGDTNTVKVTAKGQQAATTNDAILHFPSDKYTETAAHIQAAIAKGESAVCTIERGGADKNRDKSLAGRTVMKIT